MHLHLDLYLAVLRGELPAAALLARAHPHLLALCARCRLEAEADRRAEPAPATHPLPPPEPLPPLPDSAPPPDDPRHASLADLERLRRRQSAWLATARQAREHRKLVLERPAGERLAHVEAARSGYDTRAFAELMLAEAKRRVRGAPHEAAELAALVPAVLARAGEAEEIAKAEDWPAALLARAAAQRANALRVAGDLPASDRLFAELHRDLTTRPLADDAAAAEVASLEASLRIGQRRVDEAEVLLDRAVGLYACAGDVEGEARALVQQGMLLETAGRPEEAVEQLERGAARLDPELDAPLLLSTVLSRVVCFCALDRFAAADQLLKESSVLIRTSSDRRTPALVGALRGRVALGLGRHDEAAHLISASREAFFALDRNYDAALAQTYLEAGRTTELKELAAELVPQFRARGVGRETLAALVLLAKAVAAEEITAALIAKARRRLEATT